MLYNLLSKSEFKILVALNERKLYKEIADEKKISINTVKKHAKNIYRKLQVKNRAEACEGFGEIE